jgi:penicillin-binding protein 3
VGFVMRFVSRTFSAVFISVLLATCLLPLSGCSDLSAENTAQAFLADISAGHFSQAYDRISVKSSVRIDRDNFESLYTKAFDALAVTSFRASQGVLSRGQGWYLYSYKAEYQSKSAGLISEPCEMKLFDDNDIWAVEWDPSLLFSGMEWGDYIAKTVLEPLRGEIFAKDGTPLALNCIADTVFVSLPKIMDETVLVQKLSSILGIDPSVITQSLKQPRAKKDNMAIIGSYMPGSLSSEAKSELLAIPGVGIDSASLRKARLYPQGQMLSHVLGYVQRINEKELISLEDQGYDADSFIGKTGLEASYELDLKGISGEEVAIYDDLGGKKRSLYTKEKRDGVDLHLTVDPVLQQRAEMALLAGLGSGRSGAVVAMNAETGEIRALASYPTYDNSIFSISVPSDEWVKLNDKSSGQPLFNRALQGLYPPGSIIKPFVAAKAMHDGIITTNTVFTGAITDNRWIPEGFNWTFPPIKRKHESGKPLRLENALVFSDNIFFAFTALSMGREKMDELATSLGLGESFPFDLPVAKSNYVNKGTDYTVKLLADNGYGQGELLLTPLQLATYCCAFATGRVPRALLVASEYETSGKDYKLFKEFKPSLLQDDLISKNQLNILIPILRKIIDEGTGAAVGISGRDIIGKTGTAEIGEQKSRDIGWFAGISMDTPEKLLFLVMVDVPAGRSSVKFDIARYLFSTDI